MADLDITLDANSVDATTAADAFDLEIDPNAVDAELAAEAFQLECDNQRVFLFTGAPGKTSLVTSVNLVEGDLVTVNTSNQLVLADATFSTGFYDVIGSSTGTFLATAIATICVAVVSRIPVRFAVAPLASNRGDNVFLSAVAGFATLAPPGAGNAIFLLGTLAQADGILTTVDIWFRPQFITRR